MLAGLKQNPDPQPVDKDSEVEQVFEGLGNSFQEILQTLTYVFF